MVLPFCKVLRLLYKGSLKHTALKACSRKKSLLLFRITYTGDNKNKRTALRHSVMEILPTLTLGPRAELCL